MKKESSNFSQFNKRGIIEKLSTTQFDLIVIGGGATGAGIALDAASRGLKTALIEKGDFASGTSSKSTKLIHGGLRYLKQLDIALVRETGTERAVVHRLAPHLVLPEKMLMPLIKGGTYGKLSTSFGLKVYDILAGVKGDDRRKMLSKKQTMEMEPLLEEDGLKGGGFYAEYRTDDARLTIELMKTAVRNGVAALNYCKVEKITLGENGRVNGVACVDQLNDEAFQIKGDYVVSACGPWVDQVRKNSGPLGNKKLHLTKGVHIVFPHSKLPLQHTTYFDGPDGRMIFAIPRGRITYVGTTDTNYNGDLNHVITTRADSDYLIKAIHHAFPKIKLQIGDIISNWAGLRPLIHEDGKSPSELSRRDEIFENEKGLISIAGGKLTGYRKMAQRIVDKVLRKMEKKQRRSFSPCPTKKIPLTADPLANSKAVEAYIKTISEQLQGTKLDAYYASYLVYNYGKQADQIIAKMKTFADPAEIALARAELWFGVHHEMIACAEDYFVRRTGRLYFDIQTIAEIRPAIMKDFQDYFDWNLQRLQTENERMDLLIFDATHYPEEEAAGAELKIKNGKCRLFVKLSAFFN